MVHLKQMMLVKSLKNACKFFDIYGQNVNLFINKKPKFYSSFSGLLSIGVIFIVSYLFVQFMISWFDGGKMTVITSSISLSISELLDQNKTLSYDFNYQNYYVYFVIVANLPNGSYFLTKDLEKFVSYNFTYYSIEEKYERLQADACLMQYEDIFLGFGQEKINEDEGLSKKNRICIKDSIKMGLFPDLPTKQLKQPEFFFSVYRCVNSTENNNSCASDEEIDEMLEFIQVQTSIPTTIYNFQKTGNPQSNFYDYQNIQLDNYLFKYYQNGLIPTFLYTDYGILNDDYRLMGTNFNPKIFYDPKIRKKSDPLLIFDFLVNQNFQIYYQENLKIDEIAGNLGGLMNIIFLLAKILCVTYNSIYLRFKIIKATFSNPVKTDSLDKVLPKTTTSLSSSSFLRLKLMKKFSYFKYLFPTKGVRTFYKKGAENLHEYLDIRNIIKRLQDIDKLKMILLNDHQRKLFECIPKPDVVDTTNLHSLNSMLKYNKSSKIQIDQNITNGFQKETDPINQRINEFLSSSGRVAKSYKKIRFFGN